LIVAEGSARGQVIAIRDPVFTIGRDPSCQLRAKRESISRRHASIVQRGGRVFVRDHNSTNGTILGDRWFRDEEVEAHDGLMLRIRSLHFVLSVDPLPDPNASTRLPAASAGESTAARPPQVRLVVSSGRAKGQVIEIHEPLFTIGRDSSCRLRIKSFLVSRHHAAIARRDGRIFIRDMGSRHGTLLNDRLLCEGELEVRDGDSLQIADLVFRLGVSSALGEEPAAPSSRAAAYVSPRRGASRASSRRSESWIKCPDCGSEGWVPLERLLGKLVEVIRRTMPQSVVPAVPAVPAPAAVRREAVPSAPPPAPGQPVTRPGRNLDVSTFELPRFDAPPSTPAPPAHVPDDARGQSGIVPEPLTIETFDFEERDTLSEAEIPVVVDETADFPAELELSDFELPQIALHEPDSFALAETPGRGDAGDAASRGADLAAAAEPPRPPAKPQPAFVMITCPNPGCRASGAAARERIDDPMKCKVCGTDFYRDPTTDEFVIGAHPDPKTRSRSAVRPTAAVAAVGARTLGAGERTPDIEDTFRNFRRALGRNRFVVRSGAAAIFVVALLCYGATSLFSSPPELPNQVHDRAVYVAKALARNAPSRVRVLAVRSTRGDVDRWFRKIRPASWPADDEGVTIRFDIDYVRMRTRTAAIRVEVKRSRSGVKSGTEAADPASIRFRLYWVMSGDQQWQLEGSKTLDAAEKPVPPIDLVPTKKATPVPSPAPGRQKQAPRKVAKPEPPPSERESEPDALASAFPDRN
jgi:pSer/pThr/pTyr-binding forkhead associated (FHA) protein